MAKRAKRTKKINPAKPHPIYKAFAVSLIEDYLWRDKFNAEVDQIMLTVSSAPSGLRNGAPPGTVER